MWQVTVPIVAGTLRYPVYSHFMKTEVNLLTIKKKKQSWLNNSAEPFSVFCAVFLGFFFGFDNGCLVCFFSLSPWKDFKQISHCRRKVVSHINGCLCNKNHKSLYSLFKKADLQDSQKFIPVPIFTKALQGIKASTQCNIPLIAEWPRDVCFPTC